MTSTPGAGCQQWRTAVKAHPRDRVSQRQCLGARDSFDVIKQLACNVKASRKSVRTIVWSLWPRGERVERKGRHTKALHTKQSHLSDDERRCLLPCALEGATGRRRSPDKRLPSVGDSWHILPAITHTRLLSFSCVVFSLPYLLLCPYPFRSPSPFRAASPSLPAQTRSHR